MSFSVKEIICKSLLRKHKRIDSWFVARYGMNVYRGCVHDCVYCDGRAEKYQAPSDFAKSIDVKINAPQILEKELNPEKKRKPMKPGFIMIGGGVSDAYQPVESRYHITRSLIKIIQKYNYPVHILTKSTLVLNDADLLKEINEEKKAMISFSFSSTDDKISKVFEPGVPLPSERLKTIEKLKKMGFTCGMFLMPVIPFLTDTPQKINEALRQAKKEGIDFIIFGGMTLKIGRQRDFFIRTLETYEPNLIQKYNKLYAHANKWGNAPQKF